MPRTILRRPAGLRLRNFHGIYTVAPEMEALFATLRRVAAAHCTVLVGGETGTGKELVARAIHYESPRRNSPFQAVNCATFSPTLLESELFGHVRGSFTGAVRDRAGLFALAHRGTLFLDEVAEIPLDLQGKLLRVMQEKNFFPVGATKPMTVDVRVISATNKSLRREMAEGRFREDLNYRLRVVPLHLPPLRERLGDVEALFWHFFDKENQRGLRRIEGLTRTAMDAIRSYLWPGNVRELRSAVEYAFVVSEGPIIEVGDLTPEVRGEPPQGTPPQTLVDGERERILVALSKHRGRKGAAAADLGISRSTLWRKLYIHRLR
jgi:two-component system response regulator AtoC